MLNCIIVFIFLNFGIKWFKMLVLFMWWSFYLGFWWDVSKLWKIVLVFLFFWNGLLMRWRCCFIMCRVLGWMLVDFWFVMWKRWIRLIGFCWNIWGLLMFKCLFLMKKFFWFKLCCLLNFNNCFNFGYLIVWWFLREV